MPVEGVNGILNVESSALHAPQVGVANTNPQHILSVGSNLFVSGDSSDVLTVTGNVVTEGIKMGFIEIIPSYDFEAVTTVGNITSNTLQFTNPDTGFVATGNVSIGKTLTVSGLRITAEAAAVDDLEAITTSTGDKPNAGVTAQPIHITNATESTTPYTGALQLGTNSVVSGLGVSGNVHVAGGVYVTSDLAVGGSDLFVDTTTSRVGIGKVNPTVPLDVVGAVNVTGLVTAGTVTSTGLVTAGTVTSTGLVTAGTVTSTGLVTAGSVTSTGNMTVNTDDLFVDTSTSRVGVNTASPNASLHVVGNVYTSTTLEVGDDLTVYGNTFYTKPTSIHVDSNVVAEYTGPHARGEAKLKKYPEIVFEEGKFDRNDTTNTYIQAGYTVTASSVATGGQSPWHVFDRDISHPVANATAWQSISGGYNTSGNFDYKATGDHTSSLTSTGNVQHNGEYIQLETPHKITVQSFNIYSSVTHTGLRPAKFVLLGSNTGVNGEWNILHTQTNAATYNSNHLHVATVNSSTAYKYHALLTKNITSNYLNVGTLWIGELELYGYEEDPPAGDTSVDTTLKSIMNTPQTTGANVYVDAKLTSAFTNQVTGPTPVGTSTTHDDTNKYWELTGELTSNVTLEANTFLEGDQPHAVSVWFNSSNLEANVSNTCVFSISDQEKLDSVNLDLQSNTWHNLTYAYQGEGGSRVTYLDGRKVAEDQAEDTYGDYPPFAMTGYAQGGYVVSESSLYDSSYPGWKVFDDIVQTSWESTAAADAVPYATSSPGSGSSFGYATNVNAAITTLGDSSTVPGEWIQMKFPHKISVNSVDIMPQTTLYTRMPGIAVFLGSNSGNDDWVTLATVSKEGATFAEAVYSHFIVNATMAYSYIRIIWKTLHTQSSSGLGRAGADEIKIHGHRENDLVRLPDPTNVLKYPHISIPSSYTKRGYVVSASNDQYVYGANNVEARGAWAAFGNTGSEPGWQLYYDGSSNAPYASSADGSGFYQNNALASTLTGTSHRGEWIKLELPHKLMVQKMKTDHGSQPERLGQVILLGSNNDSDWYTIKDTFALTTASAQTTDINATVAYKYIVLIVKSLQNASINVDLKNLEYYGTGVDSVPIQIGGGNIDKVANFRVYDTFVGEDQALEIWDAQKDYFGRAKSQMVLQQGKLGVGTDAPQGRFSVADEPNTFEPRWPPKPLVGYKTYIEGHGEFCVHRSGDESGGEYRGNSWWIFDDNQNTHNFTYHGERVAGTNDSYFGGTNGLYDGGKSLGGFAGDWTVLESPKPIKINDIIRMRIRSAGQGTNGFIIAAANEFDGGVWTKLTEQSNLVWQSGGVGESKTFHFENDKYYKYYAIIITQAPSTNGFPTLSNMEFSGIVQQGQSVLHDGQLTLTKSLNVPRIGPPLDADDTPRRDRLVVEYNTSTNPTFEGAVRDTSGRGNDGMFYGGASYDATEKAFTFNKTDNQYLSTSTPMSGNYVHSFSMWFKPNSLTAGSGDALFFVGANGTNTKIELFMESDRINYTFGGNNFQAYPTIVNGRWYHITVTYNGLGGQNGREIYLNNVKLIGTHSESTGALNLPSSNLDIGRYTPDGSATTSAFDGSISNFKLYDTALTAEEVKTLYDMGRCDEGHHVVNFSKTRVGIGLGDGEAPRGALDVRGDIYGGCPVFFHARRTTHAESTAGAGFDPLIWQSALNNKGGGYSTTTGKFTAPIAGFYEFFYGGMSVNLDDRLEVIPKLNNVDYPGPTIYVSPDSGQQHRWAMATAIVEMKVGDTWHIRLPAGAVGLYGTGNSYNMFTGKLLSTVGGGGGGY